MIDRYLENNARYAEGFAKGELASPPAHHVAVVCCMDARIVLGRVLGLEEGDAHVIRNAGGVVTDDVVRSLLISQRKLGTREVMVVQHTACGMMSFEGEDLRDEIERETGTRPPFSMATFPELEASVREGVEKLRSSPFLPHTDAVRGFVYEVETGRLREVA